MSVVFFLDRSFDVVCNCCGQTKPGCRPIWLDPSNLRFLCPDCVLFVFPFLRECGIEIKKGGE